MTVSSIARLKEEVNLLKRHKVKLWKYPLKKHLMEDTISLNAVLEKIIEYEKYVQDMLLLARVRCTNCAESDEQFCEICAKKLLEAST